MSERSFIGIWGLAFDDVALIEGVKRPSRVAGGLSRRLTPPIHSHINPDGRHEIDLTTLIDVDGQAA